MKSIVECEFATGMNTTGMGDVTLPSETEPGSGDMPVVKKRKMKSLKEYIKNSETFR